MLPMIFNNHIFAVAKMLDMVVRAFLSWLSLDMSEYLDVFPLFEDGYVIFRGIGLGMVMVIAAASLVKFYVPGILGGSEPDDTPAGILLKTLFATALVIGGNHILSLVVDISKAAFDSFLNKEDWSTFTFSDVSNVFSTAAGAVEAAKQGDYGLGTLLGELFLVSIIAYNFFKLMVEISERYMLVGVLFFTSPPFFALSSAKATMNSFKSWIKMFISSCVMMFVSVFSLRIVLSGFASEAFRNSNGGQSLGILLLILATCKVAMRLDSYLKQIGLGTAHTGGMLLDDMLAASRIVKGPVENAVNKVNGAVEGGKKILGSMTGSNYSDNIPGLPGETKFLER